MPTARKTQHADKYEFIGREFERNQLLSLSKASQAGIVIVYGRRRVGKTELIEHTLQDRQLIKLEGVEGGNKKAQMERVLFQLSKALNEPHITKMQFTNWLEFFDFVADKINHGHWTLYLEELQWLAEYKDELISDLKYVWDNRLRHNPELLVVLCGSATSFMIKHVVHSKALYNRSTHEIYLREFSIAETKQLLKNRSPREIMDAYLTIGGIPEYLNRLNNYSSIHIGLCELSFKQTAYFSKEHDKIFISSFATNVHYKEIIHYLSRVKFATRKEIEAHLKITGGGKLTSVLKDLELCGFIENYTPYQAQEHSKLNRFCIADNYLRFYFKFIKPIDHEIQNGDFNNAPLSALNNESYQKWLGYAFERFCRKNHRLIAKILGFSAVRYQSGVYFNRNTDKKQKNYQVDLVFDRADFVLTVCEIKYYRGKVDATVIEDFEEKMQFIRKDNNKTIEKVLITANGVKDSLIEKGYFDRIITLEEIMSN